MGQQLVRYTSVFANLANFPTNPANTSPMFHAGKLLVLCEVGGCHNLNPADP
jgi:hypothetical protein